MKIEILKNKDSNFIVVIGTAVYEMNRDANMPNGLCIYSGETTDPDYNHIQKVYSLYTGDISQGIMKKIAKIIWANFTG